MKTVFIGDLTVGKTSLISRLTENRFPDNPEAKGGADVTNKTIVREGNSIKMQIWDTAGQEVYYSIPANYYKGTFAIFIVYDITKRTTFEHVELWINDINQYQADGVKILIGNKCDMEKERQVSWDQGKELAEKHNLRFSEVSAKMKDGVNEAFDMAINAFLVKSGLKAPEDETIRLTPQEKGCCGSCS